jgi:hypothetical protein
LRVYGTAEAVPLPVIAQADAEAVPRDDNKKGKSKGEKQIPCGDDNKRGKGNNLARLNARYPTLHPSEEARWGPHPVAMKLRRGWGTRLIRFGKNGLAR